MEGSHYSEEMREALKPGVTRLSFPYFMSDEAIEFVIEAVTMTAKDGWKLLPQVCVFVTDKLKNDFFKMLLPCVIEYISAV